MIKTIEEFTQQINSLVAKSTNGEVITNDLTNILNDYSTCFASVTSVNDTNNKLTKRVAELQEDNYKLFTKVGATALSPDKKVETIEKEEDYFKKLFERGEL